ncbi:hypothetical protein [Pseudoduganella lutea]|uniref:Uncharacterized protein n=1 Tax=Pseudoduganella lutea TaxID=321985 RepID=A0A4P6L2E7_9BURK|nr:hypothetical protein [Pseudoduganella lutea]QBE65776.1 hypothetical protein EWM63_24665 [Pseudoduganella lutea]
MNTDTRLGRILVVGPHHDNQALWEINARAARVPKAVGAEDDLTPGVHAMRTLHMRSIHRLMDTAEGTVRFYDPTLLDLFVARGDENGTFELSVFGRSAKVALVEASRIEITPLRAQPENGGLKASAMFVAPFESTVGKLTVPKPDALAGLLPFLDSAHPVDFDRHGIEYTASVQPPDGGAAIATRTRLAWDTRNDEVTLTLLPDRQTPDSTAAWRQTWQAMRAMADRLKVTAWSRLEFDFGNLAPALSWPVRRRTNGKLELSWAQAQLPPGLLRITLADQPPESQLLPPEMLMTLTPANVSITRNGNQIAFDTPAINGSDLEYSYTTGAAGREILTFTDPLAMVHVPAQARSALRRAYGLQPPFDQAPLTGFLQEAGGWVELPLAADPALPARLAAHADPVRAHGSMQVGLRRPELHAPDRDSLQVPWSVRIDSPGDYEIHILFAAGDPHSARIAMRQSTAQATGIVWLANRAPDGHDALPVVEADPTAFFDIVLDRADASRPAPFKLNGLVLIAPVRPATGWDDPAQPRITRAPTLDPDFGFTVDFAVLSAAPVPVLRAWLRHPSLPAIQCMPATRSDTTSALPHASRSLTLFEQAAGQLTFKHAAAMAPSIDTLQRSRFRAAQDQALVVLSLPGIELRAESPARYQATGHYGLPLLDEVYARATLPLPPGVDSPPPPPAVTALQPLELKALWMEQVRLRQVAATASDLMFGPGAVAGAIPMEPTALSAPRVLSANATVSETVTVTGKKLQMGLVTFEHRTTSWVWSASGDKLLAGPDAKLGFATAGSVEIGQGNARLLGWTFAERVVAKTVVDARGVGWASAMQASAGINRRELQVENGAGLSLASTVVPLAIGGTGGVQWRLALTDLPMPGSGAGTWTPPARDARLDTFAQGWTWSLYPLGETALGPLPMHNIFRFAPAALSSVEIDASGKVSKVTVQGALTIGADNPSHSSNSSCRVALAFKHETTPNMLMLASIEALDDPSGRISWDLDATYEESVIASGVSQLSAQPVLRPDGIHLLAAQFDVTLFGARTTVDLKDIAPGPTVTWTSPAAELGVLELRLAALEIDLKKARLRSLGLSAAMRKGVRADITETLSLPRKLRVAASLDWFGNHSTWNADIDDLRRTVCLDEPSGKGIAIFPGVKDAHIEQGVVCLTLGTPAADGKCQIVSHFAELVLAAGDLRVSHLMHSDRTIRHDQLRFDGTLRRASLVTWPDLDPVPIGAANSVQVQFAVPRKVTHTATFLLSDHRLSGALVQAAHGGGLALLPPKAGSAPASWLAEATHELTWERNDSGPRRVVRCLQVLQLWGAASLAATIKEQSAHFGFTPSYTGGNSSSEFPNHGVRQVAHAFSGLFEPGLGKQIGALGEDWLMLGNMSALCPLAKADLFQPLHLPFIGALREGEHLKKLRDDLGQRQSVNGTLRMSRHDVLATPVRLDLSGATPAGLLAAPAPAMDIAFGRAAVASGSLSGAALGAGWFRTDGRLSEAGMHVEQIQFPGAAGARPRIPHPFPRAAVMLGSYILEDPAPGLAALGVLVQSNGEGAQFSVKVETVQIQPAVDAGGARDAIPDVAELIIGDASGVGTRQVEIDAGQSMNARALLSLAMEFTGEPTFLVLRHGEFVRIELPQRRRDQLAFASRPLRSSSTFAIDGRQTWPEPEQRTERPDKAALHAGYAPRSPFQHAKAGLAGLLGRLTPARVAGQVFTLGDAEVAADSVWLQEWEQVAFAVAKGGTEDASPRAHDSAVAVRPLAPSGAAVAAAIGRMDPVLAKQGSARMQTYLPPVIEDIDLPTRMGCMTESGLRLLSTWGEGPGRQDVQALAGSAMTRAMRTPRPAATPPNTGDGPGWRRTVAWYALPGASCLALKGAWDMLAAEPAASGMPPWIILFGKATRAGVKHVAANQEGQWRGAVRVACEVFVAGAKGKPPRLDRPAHFVLDALEKNRASVRSGLRWGEAWIAFACVRAVDDSHLEFVPAGPVAPLNWATGGRFECGWLIDSGAYADGKHPNVELPAYVAPSSLDPAALRKLALALPGLTPGDYPLPLIERSVFFSDPAFDRRLSRVKAMSGTADDSESKPFSLWIDRPSATPAESLVLRAFAADNRHPKFVLTATVRRKSGRAEGVTPLKFGLATSPDLDGAILVNNGVYLSLPLTILSDASGARLADGDVLLLALSTLSPGGGSVRVAIPVRAQSALPAPDALYSLLGVNPEAQTAWCAAHSAAPQPEGLSTHVTAGADGDKVVRRGLFKWTTTQPADKVVYAYSICKTELATESMHVPDELEPELPPKA